MRDDDEATRSTLAPLLSDLLRGAPLFRAIPHLPRACLDELRSGELVVHAAGATVIPAGVPIPLLVVVDGELGLGARRYARGAAVAPAAVVLRRALPDSIRATVLTTLFTLEGSAFERLLLGCPAIAIDLAHLLADELLRPVPPPLPAHSPEQPR